MNVTLTRAGKALAVALFTTLALTGCIKVDFELVLQPDDTVDGSITYAIAEGSGAAMSDDETTYTDEGLLTDLFGELDESEYANGVITDFDEDDWIGKTITFEGEELAGFSLDAEDEGVTIVRDGDDFVVSGPYTSGDEMTEGIDGAEMALSVTFPGAVDADATNGEISEDGHTVTWDLLNAPESLEARGGATEDSGFPWWMILVAVGALVVAAAIVVVLVVVNRSGKRDSAPAVEADAAAVPMPAPALPTEPVLAEEPVVAAEPEAEGESATDESAAPAEDEPATDDSGASDPEAAPAVDADGDAEDEQPKS